MKAKIFYIEKLQEDLCEAIATQLRNVIDMNIKIEEIAIPENYNFHSSKETHKKMDLYVRMLRGAMIKINDFNIRLEYNSSNWCYLGSEHGEYTSYYSHSITLKEEQIKSIFPGVAIMNRMILLPSGVDVIFNDLHKDDFNFLFKPIDLQGVSLIDLEDSLRLKNILNEIKKLLDTEIAKYCNRYIELKKSPKPDYDELSDLLDVKKNYLQKLEPEILVSHLKITPSTSNKKIPLGKETTIKVDFLKETEISIDEVYIEIRAPFSVLKEKVIKKSLQFLSNSKESQSVEFEVTPTAYPFCPLEIRFNFNEIKYGNNPIPFPKSLILEVEAN